MKQLTKTLIVISVSFASGFSQFQGSYLQETLYNDANHIFGVSSGLLTAPFNFSHSDWEKAIYTITTTSALFFIDRNAKHYARSNQTEINNDIFQIDDYLRGTTGLYAAAGLYTGGFLIQNNTIRKMGLNALETIFLATSVTGFLKYSFGRARPYTGNDPLNFKLFRGSEEKYRAFPSGHTTGAFAFASVMAMSLDNVYWKILWYGSATMVGAARIYSNNHWLSDTFLAGIISYSIAHYVVNYESARQKNDSYEIQLYPYQMGAGIRILF